MTLGKLLTLSQMEHELTGRDFLGQSNGLGDLVSTLLNWALDGRVRVTAVRTWMSGTAGTDKRQWGRTLPRRCRTPCAGS